VPYLSATEVMIHYEEVLHQAYSMYMYLYVLPLQRAMINRYSSVFYVPCFNGGN